MLNLSLDATKSAIVNLRKLLVIICAVASFTCQASATEEFVGYAYAVGTDNLVYVETHRLVRSPDGDASLDTSYRSADGEVFATRTVNANEERVTDYKLQDTRNNYRESVRRTVDGVFIAKTRGEDTEEKTIKSAKAQSAVIDAGFNEFIRNNWNSLLDGDIKTFQFVNVDRLDLIKLRIKHAGSETRGGNDIEKFEMNAANFFIRLVLDPIEIDYYSDTRTLHRYQGISNIKDENGNNFDVRIEFAREDYTRGQADSIQ